MILEQGPTSSPNQQNHTSKIGNKTTNLDQFGPGVRSREEPNQGPNMAKRKALWTNSVATSVHARTECATEPLQISAVSARFNPNFFLINS